jgi:transcriptional regulator with XRE-family HTH domain
MDILKEFGLRIKKIRKEKNLSQEQLAEKAKVHRTYIGMIERGEKNITLTNIKKISNALETGIFELFREL